MISGAAASEPAQRDLGPTIVHQRDAGIHLHSDPVVGTGIRAALRDCRGGPEVGLRDQELSNRGWVLAHRQLVDTDNDGVRLVLRGIFDDDTELVRCILQEVSCKNDLERVGGSVPLASCSWEWIRQ